MSRLVLVVGVFLAGATAAATGTLFGLNKLVYGTWT